MKEIVNAEELNLRDKYVAVKFGAEWCGPCKVIKPHLEKMTTEYSQVKFYSLDVDEVPEMAQQFKIKSLPTLLLFKDGEEVQRIIGSVLINPLRKAFSDLIKE